MGIRVPKSVVFGVLTLAGILVASASGQSDFSLPVLPEPSDEISHESARYNPNPSAIKVARLHYSGGGDWYWGSSAIPNFLKFVRDNSSYPVDTLERQVRITDPELFECPFLFATGHGVISFSAEEKERDDPTKVVVEFDSEDHESELEARWDGGDFTVDIDEESEED